MLNSLFNWFTIAAYALVWFMLSTSISSKLNEGKNDRPSKGGFVVSATTTMTNFVQIHQPASIYHHCNQRIEQCKIEVSS